MLIHRQVDLRDLRNRALSIMNGVDITTMVLSEPTILIANELTQTDLINIDKNVVGLVSVHGGTMSHVAILAKVKGIPLLVGVNNNILSVADNTIAILDCNNGFLDLKPTDSAIQIAKNIITQEDHQQKINRVNSSVPSVTLDGKEVKCLANITNTKEVHSIVENGGDGIGLFRTEFIFYDRPNPPTVSEQRQIYSDIAKALNDMPFTIRTLDAGGEKKISYISLPYEANPLLGMRGIKLCLEKKQILIDQLTAILMVDKPNIKIMLPMVSIIEEHRLVLDIINKLKDKLKIKNNIELGIMVEVPSVALLSDIFAKEVDFFSIGTNDLAQYTLAMDREHVKLANKIDHLHPAVIRNIDLVTRGAAKYNRPVSVCGLIASEKIALPVLIGLGVHQLSMNINVIAENKAFIRKLKYTDCQQTANDCLNFATAKEVREYLGNKYQNC